MLTRSPREAPPAPHSHLAPLAPVILHLSLGCPVPPALACPFSPCPSPPPACCSPPKPCLGLLCCVLAPPPERQTHTAPGAILHCCKNRREICFWRLEAQGQGAGLLLGLQMSEGARESEEESSVIAWQKTEPTPQALVTEPSIHSQR